MCIVVGKIRREKVNIGVWFVGLLCKWCSVWCDCGSDCDCDCRCSCQSVTSVGDKTIDMLCM